jgi:hypothetical protein
VKRKLVGFIAVILLSAGVPGCAREPEIPKDPVSVVQENIKAMNDRDLDRAMATIDEQSPSYDQTKQVAKKLFEMYELKYELANVKVIVQTEDEARVGCIQTTKKVSGPGFRDNRIDFVHTLRKVDGRWKIYYSNVNKLDYLN